MDMCMADITGLMLKQAMKLKYLVRKLQSMKLPLNVRLFLMRYLPQFRDE